MSTVRATVVRHLVALALTLVPALGVATQAPQAVSPGDARPGSVVEARCPTFSWAAVPEAPGFELVILRVQESIAGEEPDEQPVVRVSLPRHSQTWTPPLGQCLQRGGRYAWSVAVAGGAPDWSTPFLFEIEAAPSLEEVDQAIATLQRYREHQMGDEPVSAASARSEADVPEPLGGDSARAPLRTRGRPTLSAADSPLPGALSSPTSGIVRVASAATPTLGIPSLKVSANVALGASSNLFKDGDVFLWDDTSGNTALGREALYSASGSATNNTALGRTTLRNTTGGGVHNFQGSHNTGVGSRALYSNTIGYSNTASGSYALRLNTTGYRNTASGYAALRANTTGFQNTASGNYALRSNTTGERNTASGAYALNDNTTGNRNTALGDRAGFGNTTGSNSIFINNEGAATDTNTIKIGTEGTQIRTHIAGIRGRTTINANAVAVLIDSAGQLGTVSSSRGVKQDIQDLGALDERLLELRPVAFRYKQHVASDPDTPREFGLIAEEVAEVFPELVVFDEDGEPETVKYHLLSSLLLGEVQKQRSELRVMRARLEALESRPSSSHPQPGRGR